MAVPLGVFVVSYHRPAMLERTLHSIMRCSADFDCDLCLVDNGSDPATLQVIERFAPRLSRVRLLGANRGINAAYESIWPHNLANHFRHVLVSDADMEYRMPFATAIDLLDTRSDIGTVSYQHSPEHAVIDSFAYGGRQLYWKRVERGCALFFRAHDLQAMRPMPVNKMLDFDWWLMRDSHSSLQATGRRVAVVPGGAVHLGWRRGESMWHDGEILEYESYRT